MSLQVVHHRVALCMIVKDESAVIARAIESARPFVDTFAICDTGSSDDTPGIVERMTGIPATRHPWIDFATNRNQALSVARDAGATHALILDADDVLEAPPGFVMPALTADAYTFEIACGGARYRRPQLVRLDKPWMWEGVVHEYLSCREAHTTADLPLLMIATQDGARRKGARTYDRDAEVLAKALGDPETPAHLRPRYQFYLAQSLRDAGRRDLAVVSYEVRARSTEGWHQEAYIASLEAARIRASLGQTIGAVLDAAGPGLRICPRRPEIWHTLARAARERGDYALGLTFSCSGIACPPTTVGDLFIEPWIFAYGLHDEAAVCASWLGLHRDAARHSVKALAARGIPEHERERMHANLEAAMARL